MIIIADTDVTNAMNVLKDGDTDIILTTLITDTTKSKGACGLLFLFNHCISFSFQDGILAARVMLLRLDFW